jgi:hypothetical protein
VREAILGRFRVCLPPLAIRDDLPGYTRHAFENLLPSLDDEEILADYEPGPGGELAGDPPSFCAAHSSAALTANTFGPFRRAPHHLVVAGISGFETARFEKTFSTAVGRTSATVDFLAEGAGGAVAVSSAFTGAFSPTPPDLPREICEEVGRLGDPGWGALVRSIQDDPSRFSYVDVGRLVLQYLGLAHTFSDGRGDPTLVYLFWEPSNAATDPASRLHREEAAILESILEAGHMPFVGLSYEELWSGWAADSEDEDLLGHVDALRARYRLPV